MGLSACYPKLTEPIVYGITFHGRLYVLQTDKSRYSLVPQSILDSVLDKEDINVEGTPISIQVSYTSTYESHQKRGEVQSRYESILWVARDTRYTIIAINTHDGQIEYLWRTSLRYALGKGAADRRIAKWLEESGDNRTDRAGRSEPRREGQATATGASSLHSFNILERLVERSAGEMKKKFTSCTAEGSPPRSSVRHSEVANVSLSSILAAEADVKLINDHAPVTLLTLPPELHEIIFSYLGADDLDLAECLPSTWESSWASWQKRVALTCKTLFDYLQHSLHEQVVMHICSQCCLSEAGITLCTSGCRERWLMLSQSDVAHRIRRLEIRPHARESVKTATAGEVFSAVSKCINLNTLRWPEKSKVLPEPDSFPNLSAAWGPAAYFTDHFKDSLNRLRHITIEIAEGYQEMPEMSSVQHLRIIMTEDASPPPSLRLVRLDCSRTPRLKTLSIEKIKRHPLPANAHIFHADKTPLQVLRLRHCWCTRRLIASLPPSLQWLELNDCEDATKALEAEPVELPSLKTLRIVQDDYQKERFLRYLPNIRAE